MNAFAALRARRFQLAAWSCWFQCLRAAPDGSWQLPAAGKRDHPEWQWEIASGLLAYLRVRGAMPPEPGSREQRDRQTWNYAHCAFREKSVLPNATVFS